MPRSTSLALLTVIAAVFSLSLAHAADPDGQAEAIKRFKKLPGYVKNRQATHVVETLVEWREYVGAEERDAATDLMAAVYADTQKDFTHQFLRYPKTGHGGYCYDSKLNRSRRSTTYLIEACEAVGGGINESVVICSGEFGMTFGGLHDCLVLCSSSVEATNNIDNSFIVAAGKGPIRVETDCMSSVLVCGGDMHDCCLHYSLCCVGGKVEYDKKDRGSRDECKLLAEDKKLYGVNFYKSSDDGLEATEAKKVVSVKAVDAKKPFAVGVKVGDVIESVNGKPVDNLIELNRLLCRATVASGTAKLKVTRDGKSQEIAVQLAEW